MVPKPYNSVKTDVLVSATECMDETVDQFYEDAGLAEFLANVWHAYADRH